MMVGEGDCPKMNTDEETKNRFEPTVKKGKTATD